MRRVGGDDAGFSTEYDPVLGAIRVRGWGFWSTDVAEAFVRTVREECQGNRRGAALLLDMTDLKPLREEGQRSFSTLIRSLGELRVARTAVLTASHLTKLQLLRLVAECGAGAAVQFATPGTELASEIVSTKDTMQKERITR